MKAVRLAGRLALVASGVFVLGAPPIRDSSSISADPKASALDRRRLAILYTNDVSGVLEPCRCSADGGVAGGLARRATLIRGLRSRFGQILLVDSGNVVDIGSKAGVALESMRRMGYDAIGMGVQDLLCRDAFLSGASRSGVPVLSSLPDLNKLPSFVQPGLVCVVGGSRVGVLALSPSPALLSAAELFGRLAPVLRELRREADLVVVLSQLGFARDQALARRQADQGWIDVIIGNTEAAGLAEPLAIGRTRIVPTSTRGRDVGLIEVHWQDGAPHFSARRLPVDDRYKPDARIQADVDAFQQAQAEQLRRDSALPARIPATPAERLRLDWLPALECGRCHAGPYALWQEKQRRHAAAMETLRRRNRLIPECLTCHSEFYRREGRLPPDTAVGGVECSACHGPGVVHRLLQGKGGITRSAPESVCRSCHNAHRDPSFDFASAKEKIRHW